MQKSCIHNIWTAPLLTDMLYAVYLFQISQKKLKTPDTKEKKDCNMKETTTIVQIKWLSHNKTPTVVYRFVIEKGFSFFLRHLSSSRPVRSICCLKMELFPVSYDPCGPSAIVFSHPQYFSRIFFPPFF